MPWHTSASVVREYVRSSVAAHLSGNDDGLVTVAPVLGRYGDFPAFLAQEEDAAAFKMLRQSERQPVVL